MAPSAPSLFVKAASGAPRSKGVALPLCLPGHPSQALGDLNRLSPLAGMFLKVTVCLPFPLAQEWVNLLAPHT